MEGKKKTNGKRRGNSGKEERRMEGRKQRKEGLDFFSDYSLHPENNLSPIQAFVGYK